MLPLSLVYNTLEKMEIIWNEYQDSEKALIPNQIASLMYTDL